jgi:hypothetical protein
MMPPLCALIFLPEGLRCLNIGLLPLFRAAAKQDHQLLAVFAEIHPIAGTEFQAQLENP